MRWAFPVTVLLHLPGRVPQRCAGSSIVPCPGFPFRASGAVYHTPTFSTAGTSGASQVLRRLSSCMPRPEDSGGPAPPRHIGWARVAFGSVKTLGVRNSHVEAVPALQGARSPLRPTGYSVYASSILFAASSPHDSAMDARLDTGGWLPLTRQGLSPCKRRQAYLGAITLGVRRGNKRSEARAELVPCRLDALVRPLRRLPFIRQTVMPIKSA